MLDRAVAEPILQLPRIMPALRALACPVERADEETDDPTHADRRNFYKVEKWSRDGAACA
jgi:hypothetical protein